jgi:type I site-specific restriction-modification system R (restriction) subunit
MELTVDYPQRYSEFEIQASVWSVLKKNGVDVRGEVKALGCRFDLVIYKNKEPICIIEVKNKRRDKPEYEVKSKQLKRYRLFGIPVLYCANHHYILSTVDKVLELLNTGEIKKPEGGL